MYATAGTRLSAEIPLAFAKPAAPLISDKVATGVPYWRSRSSAAFARSTFGALKNGAAGCCISTITGNRTSVSDDILLASAGSIFSEADSARPGVDGTTSEMTRSAQLIPISRPRLMRRPSRRDRRRAPRAEAG
jgi:hypothetical protein